VIPGLPKGFSHPMTIGEGSFSSVFRARQKILDRWVAIKILHEKDASRRLELLSEARNQAQMRIACIPAVYDAFSKGQRIFIVMEWIKGASLQAILEKGIADRRDREALAASMVAALAGLHSLGFAHRDFKPANVLVSGDAGVHLVDFGFSRHIGEGGRSVAGVVRGTPAYMAPEIWQGRGGPDYRKADLFALGKVLKELDLGPPWAPLIAPLLSADPGNRPASAADVLEACAALPAPRATPGWKAEIAALSSGLLSQRLLHAAKHLLFARRSEEAYWLLAECLQEDPDNAEALRLIENFPVHARDKSRKRWMLAAASAAVFGLALSAAFHSGKRSEREARLPSLGDRGSAKALLLPAPDRARPSGRAPAKFREFAPAGGGLAGLLFVEGAEACDSLFLDARRLRLPLRSDGISVASGEHTLVCRDRNGALASRERISMLPFQRKLVRIHPKPSKRES
jgi:serine/threonine protein kinase